MGAGIAVGAAVLAAVADAAVDAPAAPPAEADTGADDDDVLDSFFAEEPQITALLDAEGLAPVADDGAEAPELEAESGLSDADLAVEAAEPIAEEPIIEGPVGAAELPEPHSLLAQPEVVAREEAPEPVAAIDEAVEGSVDDALDGAIEAGGEDPVAVAADDVFDDQSVVSDESHADDGVADNVDAAFAGDVEAAVEPPVGGASADEVELGVEGSVEDEAEAAGDGLADPVEDLFVDAVEDAVEAPLEDAVDAEDAVEDAVEAPLEDVFEDAVADDAEDALEDVFEDVFEDAVEDAVEDVFHDLPAEPSFADSTVTEPSFAEAAFAEPSLAEPTLDPFMGQSHGAEPEELLANLHEELHSEEIFGARPAPAVASTFDGEPVADPSQEDPQRDAQAPDWAEAQDEAEEAPSDDAGADHRQDGDADPSEADSGPAIGLDFADDTIPGAAPERFSEPEPTPLASAFAADGPGLDLALGRGLDGLPEDELDPDAVFGGGAGSGSPFFDDEDPDEERTQLDMTVPVSAWEPLFSVDGLPAEADRRPAPAVIGGGRPVLDPGLDEDEDATAQVRPGQLGRASILGPDPFLSEAHSGGHTHRVGPRGAAEPAAEAASGATGAATVERGPSGAPVGRREPDTADAFAALSLKMPSLSSPQARELGSAPLGREAETGQGRAGARIEAESASARLRPEERSARAELASGRTATAPARQRPPEIHSSPLPPGARRGNRPVDPWASAEGTGPRVVEGEAPAPEPLGAAAIQILGIGKARTLSQTLELEGTGEEPAGEEWGEQDDGGDGDLAVSFQEPAEQKHVRVPQLTDAPATPTAGPGLLTAEGIISTEAPPDTRSGIASGPLRAMLAEADEAARRGKLKEAVVLYGDVLEHDPELLPAWLGRGRSLVDLSDYAAAMSDFTRAEDVAPDDPMPPYEMGNLFFARKEYGKSIGYYDTALQADPNHAPSLARRGSAHLQRKDPALALADLQKAEKLDPTIPGIGRQVQLAKNQVVPPKKKGGR